MTFIYTRAQLKSDINRGIFGKIGMLISEQDTMNEIVRTVTSDLDMRSARRQATLSPNLYNGIYDYACPADLDAMKLIDIPAQAKRGDGEFFLVPTTEFAISPKKGMVSIKDFNGTRVLQVNSNIDSKSITISELDGFYSGGGTWELFGDAEFLGADDADFVKGAGSLTFDINDNAGTTAGIVNSSLNPVDLSNYLGGTSSFFVWAKITSVTNLTDYKLRFGNDSSNYHTLTTTTRADGTAFVNGWNLLKFDLNMSVAVETGTVDETNITYAALYMTKTTGKVSETDYKFDWLVLKKGVVHNIDYYSKYGWVTAAGAYIENSTSPSDLLVADKDEYDLIVAKGREIAGFEVKEFEASAANAEIYKSKKRDYQMRNPSEAKIMTSEYHTY